MMPSKRALAGVGWRLSPSSARRSVARRAGCWQVWRWLGVGFLGVLCGVLSLLVDLAGLGWVLGGCHFWYGALWCGSLWGGMGIGAIEGLNLLGATIPDGLLSVSWLRFKIVLLSTYRLSVFEAYEEACLHVSPCVPVVEDSFYLLSAVLAYFHLLPSLSLGVPSFSSLGGFG